MFALYRSNSLFLFYMGHKINPRGLRIKINATWTSKWFGEGKSFSQFFQEDIRVREYIKKTWKHAGIAEVEFERSSNFFRIIVKTSRPGIIIGRGGSGVEDMTKKIKEKFFRNKKVDIKVDVHEIRYFEENASLLAQHVAEQLEKRMPFRRVLKTALDQAEKNKTVQGVKIEIAGRLGGAEMSRREWLSRGTIPLHTLRANIDFSKAIAYTTYGTIGVKTWLYKGEKQD